MKKNKIIISSLFLGLLINLSADDILIPLDKAKVVDAKELKTTNVDSELEDIKNNITNAEAEKEKIVSLSEIDSSLGSSADKPINIAEELIGDDDFKFKTKKENLIEMKKYKNVHYVKGYEWFSVDKPNESTYKKYLRAAGISPSLDTQYLRKNSKKGIFVSALYYDYIKKQPELAENFYLKFPKYFSIKNKYQVLMKLAMSDYLVRTGRGDKINQFLSRSDCYVLKKRGRDKCLYYHGLYGLFKYGTKQSSDFRISKETITQAKKIYYKK